MTPRTRALLGCLLAAQLAGCAGTPPPAAPPAPLVAAPPRMADRDPATAAALEAVLGGPQRTEASRARDAARHPLDTLLFFGLKPGMTVVEAWPDSGGWYTEILAPLLKHGRLYAALKPPDPGNSYVTGMREAFAARLAAHPDVYRNVTMTSLGPQSLDIAPPESCDMAVTFRGLHNWMSLGFAKEAFAAIHRALKPGGILGVVGHRGAGGKPQDPRATNGYVEEDYAIALIESAGFELVERAEINANPKDTRDYEQGVWALPPDYRAGNRDREKYQAIGESDRFTLKFRKKH